MNVTLLTKKVLAWQTLNWQAFKNTHTHTHTNTYMYKMCVTNSANNFVNDVDVLDYGFLEGEFYSHILLSAISWESFVVHLVYEREFQVHEENFSE